MTEQDIMKWGEIQYLTGRLDELYYKAIPNVLDLHGSRQLDVRVQKYLDKLKEVDEIAYLSYLVQRSTKYYDKQRGQKKMKDLLTEILKVVEDPALQEKIQAQINKYHL
jgi:hypothetical protein